METKTNNDNKAHCVESPTADDSDIRNEALDQLFAEMALRESPQPATKVPAPAPQQTSSRPRREAPAAHEPVRCPPVAPFHDENPRSGGRFLKALCIGGILLGAALFYRGMPPSWQAAVNPFGHSAAATLSATPASQADRDTGLKTKPIEDVRLGDRLAGRNPIREQAELIEPDPATWRQVDLYMTKENGLGLWIGLLRPLAWIEAHEAKPGSTVYLELYEMGAVGDAEVNYVGPCPEIQPGKGTVVIGTFKHQADKDSNVVRLELEDQLELTGVTANHPYWSEDRQDFVEAGDLRTGELVDTAYGVKHVISVTPIEHDGFLYNLETTEHVYRVGSLGTLVHNNCLGNNMRRAGSYGDVGTDAHHIVAYSHGTAKPARDILAKHSIDINDAINGVWLPRNSAISRARGALHREAGSALTNSGYLNEVNRRILAADAAGGKAHVLRELQKIRFDLLNGTFPGVRPNF